MSFLVLNMEQNACSIKPTVVSDMRSYVIENDKLRLVLMPEAGAKIANLIYKPSEEEFLWHNPRMKYKRPSYGEKYVECTGFDDCLPSIWACKYKGRDVPEHGDLWALPWNLQILRDEPEGVLVELDVMMKCLPFKIKKRIELNLGEARVRFEYSVKNLSSLLHCGFESFRMAFPEFSYSGSYGYFCSV